VKKSSKPCTLTIRVTDRVMSAVQEVSALEGVSLSEAVARMIEFAAPAYIQETERFRQLIEASRRLREVGPVLTMLDEAVREAVDITVAGKNPYATPAHTTSSDQP
jgi:hypothetical protein